ncbi:MAG: ABC transporter permease [Bacteroidales bacterium]|nr:ABC transporter permease [Bacteroidota bacterium]MBL6950018.1 ABC transporter permease [Bacteroidales bacterium]
MNTELFIANRMVARTKSNFSRPIVVIAIISIALGLSVMFLSIAILSGFQKEIREKVIGFGGHIQVIRFEENQSFEPKPINKEQEFLPALQDLEGIRHIQVFATKAGIIKTEDQIQGIVLKGIGSDYDWSFFQNKIKEGRSVRVTDTSRSDEVIISRKLCNLLNLKLDDDLRVYFVSGNHVLGRKFTIVGIFETGLEEFDNIYILGDIHHIRRLNKWEPGEVGGFEILIDDFNDIDRMGKEVYRSIGFDLDASTIKQLYPQIFDWLSLQDINVMIILILMILVAGITMISTLLILILERTNTIGVLKAMGMKNSSIRKVFLYQSVFIIGLGILIGNLFGFGFCFLQIRYGLVTLPQESYYMSVVPIHLNGLNILLLNLGTILVCYLMLLIPSMIISRISPIKAIRFS